MSKKALFIIPLSVGLLSICSCSWLFNTKENYIEKQNPGNIIKRVTERSICSFYYKNDEWDTSLEDKDGAILTKLRNVSEFTYINKKPSLSDEHFSYYAKTPAIIFGYNTHQIEIYDNGYAVTWGNSNDTIAYYYQFDEDVAKSLLTVVKNKYQELIENKKREQVSNEAVQNGAVRKTNNYGSAPNYWYETIGEDFVYYAFKYARQYAEEDQELYYNDYAYDYDTNNCKFALNTLLKDAIAEELIDGVGIQGHLDMNNYSLDSVIKDAEMIKEKGLKCQITELDITVNGNDNEHK